MWRTSDWQEESSVTEPFVECGATTYVLRLAWSPDGQFLVSAHAMNNCGSTAQIIEREGFSAKRDFVGHRKAVTCVRFNQHLLLDPKKVRVLLFTTPLTSSPLLCVQNPKKKPHPYCCLAIGSRDRSLSVWVTKLQRPLLVMHDLFTNSVLDLSWSSCGTRLLACSWDGTVSFMEFSLDELGKPMSADAKDEHLARLYGKSIGSVQDSGQFIEDPEILKAREERDKKQENGKITDSPSRDASRSSVSQSRLIKGPTDKQIETTMANGKRRITPLYIPPPSDFDGAPAPYGSSGQITFSSSTENKTKIPIEKRASPQKVSCDVVVELSHHLSLFRVARVSPPSRPKTRNPKHRHRLRQNRSPHLNLTRIPTPAQSRKALAKKTRPRRTPASARATTGTRLSRRK